MPNQVVRVFAPQPVTMRVAVDAFLAVCRAKNLSPNTTAYYSYRLRAFMQFLDAQGMAPSAEEVTPTIIRDFLTHEREANSAVTACHAYVTLSAFYNHLLRDGVIDSSPMEKVQKPKRPQRIIPTFDRTQIERLFAVMNGRDFLDTRDRAILITLLDTGIRASELTNLTVADIGLESNQLRVIGKGDKERIVPFSPQASSGMLAYFLLRNQLIDNYREPDLNAPFFVTSLGDPMDRHALRSMLMSRGKRAGIKGVRVSPHTMRHTAAVSFLRGGGDAFRLQKLLGHSDLTMTRKYCELNDDDLREAYRHCSPLEALVGRGAVPGRRKRIR